MKKIISVFFLLSCGLIILLATVDLEPYLASDQPDIPEKVSLPPVEKADEPPSKISPSSMPQTETPSTVISAEEPVSPEPESAPVPVPGKLEDLFENLKSAATVAESTTEMEAVPPSTTKVAETAEGAEQVQPPSSLIELEVTILPVGEYPFSILLDTFLEQEKAQQAIDLYQSRNISAHWVKVNLGEKGIRYRLFTGIFATVPEAQQYLDQNQLFDKLIKPTYYSALVGVYQDKVQLASAFVKAQDTGFIPYILGTQKSIYHLYVGAFYTYIGASTQCRALAKAGLHCEPVRRSTIPPQ
ncbi:MAG: hypothetical protein GY799_05585 [Desulfobulbaceae bacterium]|nr:hypothetical protein [Desulfobulbaceae bacterium]